MRISSLLMALSLVLPCLGRADQPTVPVSAAEPVPAAVTATPAAVTAAPAETNPATADPAAGEKSAAQLKRDAAEAKIRQYGANGYKPETTKGGEVVYCKKEASIGSRFETKQCRTFDQLRNDALSGKEYLENLQHSVQPGKG